MQGVILIFLIIMNWVIYHKIFKVIYFGSVSKSLGREFIWCAIGAAFEMAAIMYVGKIVLILLLIVAGIIFAIWLIYKIYKLVKNISEKAGEKKEDDSSASKKQENVEKGAKNSARVRNEWMFCVNCGKKIKRDAKFCNYCGAKNNYKGVDKNEM